MKAKNIPKDYPAAERLVNLIESAIIKIQKEERICIKAKQTERRGLDED